MPVGNDDVGCQLVSPSTSTQRPLGGSEMSDLESRWVSGGHWRLEDFMRLVFSARARGLELVAIVVTSISLATPAAGGVIAYTDRDAWFGAVGGVTTIGFPKI